MQAGIGFCYGLAVAVLLALSGCGAGSGSGLLANGPSPSSKQSSCTGCGTAVVSLTDAPGDFVSYIVQVDSLSLTRSNGSIVQTVPAVSQVDFTQLVNLSEILTADQVPPGSYTSAQLTLDYSHADIVVSTANGNVTVPAADLIDGATGSPISGPLTITLSFPNHPLVITEGTVSHLALDFNLSASNTVALNASPVTVTVNPVLSATLAPDTSKLIHVRGPLVSVSAANSDYVVEVWPFEDKDDSFGQFTVDTTSSTTFLINGTSYTGSAGLTALAALPAQTLTTAYGAWDTSTKTFTASTVHAGSSVVGVSGNAVVGTVVARSGDTLTLANALAFVPPASGSSSGWDDDLAFQPQVTVTVGSATTVAEQGQSGTFSIADLSIGQRVRFTGTLGTSGSGTTLDATSGSALLEPTRGVGLYSSAGTGSIAVNLQSLGSVPATELDFTGTGASSATDASASDYEVQIPSSFSSAAFTAGLPVEFTGFAAPFGTAPPDFSATTVISFGQARAKLQAFWSAPGTQTAFTALSSTELVIGQAALEAATVHTIRIADTQIDASSLSTGVTLVPASTSTSSDSGMSGSDDSEQVFVIAHQSSETVDTFATFSDFTTALNADLANGSVIGIAAQGLYGANGTITVQRVFVVLND
jgi:hypothetical protein